MVPSPNKKLIFEEMLALIELEDASSIYQSILMHNIPYVN
jgi:hypothetical protein